MIPGLLVFVVALLSFLALVQLGVVKVGREEAPTRVAAPSDAPRGRLAELVEENGMLRADMKALRREWEDFSKSWERRWGTVTRAQRRDDAAASAAASAAEPEPADPSQLDFTVPGQVPLADAPRRRLQPVRLMGRSG